MSDDRQLLYRPEEAAAQLGLSRAKFFRLLSDGTIRSVKIGRSRRVSRWELEDYVARLREQQYVGGDAA